MSEPPQPQSTAITTRTLRCTVNGGLEDFANREVENVLKEVDGKEADLPEVSIERGNTGSRMFIKGVSIDNETISTLLQTLRYVDYVSLHLGSSECHKTTEEGMSEATNKIMGGMGDSQRIVDIFRTSHDLLNDKQVGLESLPGKILPQVNMKLSDMKNDEATSTSSFAPNTIYTRPEVAKLVVETVKNVLKNQMDDSALLEKSLWLDAGCGNGSLLQEMPENRRIGVDLNPIQDCNDDDMYTANFLKDVTIEWLRERSAGYTSETPLIVISNPPFAQDSRGNYRPIVQFLQHSLLDLKASLAAFIVPTKFARQRVMESYGMDLNMTTIVARMNLPNNAFYDPSTNESKHIPSTLLIMKRVKNPEGSDKSDATAITSPPTPTMFRIRVEGSRNKSHFRNVSTQSMETSVRLAMMEHFGVDNENISQQDRDTIPIMTVSAELTKQGKGKAKAAVLDLWLQLNPKRPLSLVNCQCANPSIRPPHSLGWVTTSCKPNVAAAMVESVGILDGGTGNEESPAVVVNVMCGEATLELEASSTTKPCLWLSGDCSRQALLKAKKRISSLQTSANTLFYDFVQWDCQNLPLRDGVVDAFLADLPIAGGTGKSEKSKAHYKPTSEGDSSTANLDYRTVIRQSLRVLTPGTGRGAFVSVDANSLKHGMLSYQSYWMPVLEQNKMTLGGLPGIFFCIERRPATTKNVSMWLEDSGKEADYSEKLLVVAQEACGEYSFDRDSWELDKATSDHPYPFSFIAAVHLVDVFQSESDEESRISHCYRMVFNPIVSNQQSKDLERDIREALKKNPIAAGQELR